MSAAAFMVPVDQEVIIEHTSPMHWLASSSVTTSSTCTTQLKSGPQGNFFKGKCTLIFF